MACMHAVMKARFADRPAGHWVVFKTNINGIDLFAVAYAWSQRGASYFLSTCGKTPAHKTKYLTHFEDE